MSIKTIVNPSIATSDLPALRRWTGVTTAEQLSRGDLVVLFTSPEHGVALSGVTPERIGKQEPWHPYNCESWEPCSITLASEN